MSSLPKSLARACACGPPAFGYFAAVFSCGPFLFPPHRTPLLPLFQTNTLEHVFTYVVFVCTFKRWTLAAKLFAEKPFSNGHDARYEARFAVKYQYSRFNFRVPVDC